MSFPRYPAYKDSGVEWLGEVPDHWDVQLVKNLASIVNGYPFDSALFDATEGSPLIRIRDLNKSEAETFYKGDFVEAAAVTANDVLIGMDGDFNVGRWYGDGRALLNQRMCCVRGKSIVVTRLLEYILPIRLKAINDVTYATTVKHLASSQVEKTLVAIPPDVSEQTKIAAFLDRETAKIDELVAEQRRLMALLKEKRQAVISHAVTRGLNPDAPMKPSGIEWLGNVPEHWEVTPIGHLSVSLSYGFTNPMPTTDDGPYMLTANDIDYGRVKYDSARRTSPDAFSNDVTEKSRPKKGDILITKDGTLGRVAIHEGQDACINQSVASLRVKLEFLRPEFMAACLLGGLYQGRMIYDAGGTTIKHIYISRLAKMPIAYPSLAEQDQLLVFLETELAKFDTLTTEAQRAIDLLQERRTALISAAVTGQIDVRGEVASRAPDAAFA